MYAYACVYNVCTYICVHVYILREKEKMLPMKV